MDVFLSDNSVAIKTNERQLKKNLYVEEDEALFAIRSSSIPCVNEGTVTLSSIQIHFSSQKVAWSCTVQHHMH